MAKMFDIKNSYTSKNFWEIVTQWSQNNNILEMERDFSLEGMHAITNFKACLFSNLEFNKESYNKFIKNLSYEIIIGEDIIENFNKLEEMDKTSKVETSKDIKDIRKSVEEKLKIQKDHLDRLTKFLEKMESLPEYKKDVKKYEKEISEALSIL